MKYYISDIKSNDIEKYIMNNTFIKKEEYYTLIFSQDGIFRLDKNDINNKDSIKKITYKDLDIKHIQLPIPNNKFDFFEDNSYMIYNDISQIPLEHSCLKIRSECYTLREKASLKLVIIRNEVTNNIIDFYFETDITIYNEFIIQDVAQFLKI